jgi:hypothetical protein
MTLIKVAFRPGGQQYTYDAGEHDLAVGDRVVVPTEAQGEDMGIATVEAIGSGYSGPTKTVMFKLHPGQFPGQEKPDLPGI